MADPNYNPNADYNAGVAAPASTGEGTYNAANLNPVYTPGNSYTPPASISSANLSTPTAPTFQSPQQTPITPVAGINVNPPLTMTVGEQQAQNTTTELQSLNDQLTGQSAFKTSQEQAQGLDALNKTYTDLSGRLKSLQADAINIPNQMQLRAEGRDVTQGELTPLTTAALRRNSIEANTVGALLAASQGQISYAQSLVDKAVAAKFDPIKEQIDAKTKNLNLILNSPSYSLQQKNRAQAQLDVQNAKAAELEKQKQDAKDIYGLSTSAAANGADSLTLDRISKAKTPQEALSVLTQSGFARDPLKVQKDQAELAKTKAETAKLYAEASKATGESGVDPAQLIAYAQQYASTGKIPTGIPKGMFGAVAQLAKETPKPDGTIISNSTGVVPDNISGAQAEGLAALRDLTIKLDTLKTQYQNTSLLSTNAQRQQYTDLNGEIVDLLSRARSGAALTESEVATYSKKIPQLFSVTNLFGANRPATGVQKITDLKASLEGKLNTSLAAHNSAMVGFSQVNLGGQKYTVGQIVTNDKGQSGRVNSDGSITPLQ